MRKVKIVSEKMKSTKTISVLGIILSFFICSSVLTFADQGVDSSGQTVVENDSAARRLISVIQNKISTHELNTRLHDEESEQSEDEIAALGRTGSSLAIPVLDEIISRYPSVVAKHNALLALQKLSRNQSTAIDVIRKALNDKNLLIKATAAHILARQTRENDAIPVLIKIASIEDMRTLDEDILEDESYHSDFIVWYLCEQGKCEEAARLNPTAKSVPPDIMQRWGAEFSSLREHIVEQAIADLANYDDPKVKDALTMIASRGPIQGIREAASRALEVFRK